MARLPGRHRFHRLTWVGCSIFSQARSDNQKLRITRALLLSGEWFVQVLSAGVTTVGIVERVRWGIIGVGDVTERKSGPGFQQAERSELVAVMRRNGFLAADFARRHGIPRSYSDADELINDPEVDAVYVATPPDSHRDYVLRVGGPGSRSMWRSPWLVPQLSAKPWSRHARGRAWVCSWPTTVARCRASPRSTNSEQWPNR